MKTAPDKYHLLVINIKENFQIAFENEANINRKVNMKKLLGIKIVHDLSFNDPVTSLCKKVSLNLNALSRIALSITFNKRREITVKWSGCSMTEN